MLIRSRSDPGQNIYCSYKLINTKFKTKKQYIQRKNDRLKLSYNSYCFY
jgi:hypothetical protein